MSDLTVSLMALAASSRGRRMDRTELRNATDTVAKAIADQLRSGDEVTINEASYRIERTTYTEGRAGFVPGTANILCRNGARLQGTPEQQLSQPYAEDSARIAFIAEAEAVIRAFTKLCEDEGRVYGTLAATATRLALR